METWEWPYHTVSAKYMPNNSRVTFGGGWEFAAAPDRPHQRIFTLKMTTLRYFAVPQADPYAPVVLDLEAMPELNLGRLEDFYRRHSVHKNFTYPHPAHGNIRVRFQQELEVPHGIPDAQGWIETFDVKLLEIPV